MADRVITAASSSKAPGCVPKQSLAATHPSNYGQVARKTMLPPSQMVQNPQISKKTQKAAAVKERRTLRHGYPTPSLSPEATAQDRHGPGRERIMRPDPTSPTLNHSATASVATASQPKAEQQARMPWQMHTDPTFTTSDAPVFWTRNHTVLKTDTTLQHGTTVSPTPMHGLPFGSMTEAAYHYPEEERLARG